MSSDARPIAKGFVDNLDTVVASAVQGLTSCSGGRLKYISINGGAEANSNTAPATTTDSGSVHVVVRSDFEAYKAAGKVAVICGGG